MEKVEGSQMAILPRSLSSPQSGSGLLGSILLPVPAEPGLLDRLNRGLSDNSGMLIGLGSDIMKSGFRGGFERAMHGAASDTRDRNTRQTQQTALSYIAAQRHIDSQLKAALLQNPVLAAQYMERVARPEFKTVGPYYGTFLNGEFQIQGAVPDKTVLAPEKATTYFTAPAPTQNPTGVSTAIGPVQAGGPIFASDAQVRKETASPSAGASRYAQVLPMFRSMVRAHGQDSATADRDLVAGLAKVLDATAQVQDGKVESLDRAQAIPEDVQVLIKRVANGEGRLTPQARARILDLARMKLGELKQDR
jgi:hypothetical protein